MFCNQVTHGGKQVSRYRSPVDHSLHAYDLKGATLRLAHVPSLIIWHVRLVRRGDIYLTHEKGRLRMIDCPTLRAYIRDGHIIVS